MDLGITNLMSNYSLGGVYPWNNLSYMGGFSSILNQAYNTIGKGYTIEVDETGQISKITVKDTGEQAVISPTSVKQQEQEVSNRKVVTTEQWEDHQHRLRGCCKRHTV